MQSAKFALEMARLGEGSPEHSPTERFWYIYPRHKVSLRASLEKLRGFAVPLPSSHLPVLSRSVETFSMPR